MGTPAITRFLTSLAVDGKVAASTQNQALSALLFLYREVLRQEVPWLDDLVYAKRPHHLPVVLTREEAVRTGALRAGIAKRVNLSHLPPTPSPPISWRTATTSGRSRGS